MLRARHSSVAETVRTDTCLLRTGNLLFNSSPLFSSWRAQILSFQTNGLTFGFCARTAAHPTNDASLSTAPSSPYELSCPDLLPPYNRKCVCACAAAGSARSAGPRLPPRWIARCATAAIDGRHGGTLAEPPPGHCCTTRNRGTGVPQLRGQYLTFALPPVPTLRCNTLPHPRLNAPTLQLGQPCAAAAARLSPPRPPLPPVRAPVSAWASSTSAMSKYGDFLKSAKGACVQDRRADLARRV